MYPLVSLCLDVACQLQGLGLLFLLQGEHVRQFLDMITLSKFLLSMICKCVLPHVEELGGGGGLSNLLLKLSPHGSCMISWDIRFHFFQHFHGNIHPITFIKRCRYLLKECECVSSSTRIMSIKKKRKMAFVTSGIYTLMIMQIQLVNLTRKEETFRCRGKVWYIFVKTL